MKYFETSDLTGEGIYEMIQDIMAQTYDYKIIPKKLQNLTEEERKVSDAIDLTRPRTSLQLNKNE